MKALISFSLGLDLYANFRISFHARGVLCHISSFAAKHLRHVFFVPINFSANSSKLRGQAFESATALNAFYLEYLLWSIQRILTEVISSKVVMLADLCRCTCTPAKFLITCCFSFNLLSLFSLNATCTFFGCLFFFYRPFYIFTSFYQLAYPFKGKLIISLWTVIKLCAISSSSLI